MKPIHALAPTLALSLILGLAAALLATEPAEAGAGTAPVSSGLAADEDESPLARAMEGLQNGMRTLRGLAKGTEDTAACLEVLHSMQASAIAAVQLEPHVPEGQEPPPAAELAVWKLEFKRQIVKLIDKLYELEIAVVEGRFDALQEGYSDLNELKNDGHYEYQ